MAVSFYGGLVLKERSLVKGFGSEDGLDRAKRARIVQYVSVCRGEWHPPF